MEKKEPQRGQGKPQIMSYERLLSELITKLLERLDGLDRQDQSGRSRSLYPKSNGTSLIIVTLLLGILIGAVLALLLSGCVELIAPQLAASIPLLGVFGKSLRPGQIQLVHQDFFSLIVDKDHTVQPVDPVQARAILKAQGYQKIEVRNEQGYTTEIWEMQSGQAGKQSRRSRG